ncbi:MAG TPA: PKD domain-containing protein, partial [Lentisphaeria bacterium]|nr:PKD domain-containing protein [Lentisphaeria bacterium]
MHSEKNTGIHLASQEYTPLKVATSGVYWDADFQNLLRSQDGSDRARFFPRVELTPNGALFSLTDQGRELAADSKPMARRKLPPRELDQFVDAMMNFQKLADVGQMTSQAPPPDPTKIAFIKTFRLPDPDRQPESYRLAGPWFNQRLVVLWGYDRQPDGGSFPANDAQEIRRRLLPYVDPHYGWRRLSARLLHVAAAVLLIFLIWPLFRSSQAPVERCPACQEKLTAEGACQNRCADCGEHLRSGQCPSCRPRGQHLTVAPRQAIMTGDIVTAWADQPGLLAIDGYAKRQVSSANDKVHCRFPIAGDYAITWEPEAGELNGEFVRLSVRAPLSAEQPPAPFQAVLLLHPNPAAPGQTITAIDASFTDVPGRSIARRDIQWGDQADWQTLAEAGSRSFPTPGNVQVTLQVTDDSGAVASSTVTLVVTDQPIEPTVELDVTPTACRPGEIVLARDLSPDWPESIEIQREITWGDGDAFAPMPDQETRHVFTKPGNYQVTLRQTDSNRRIATATKTVTVQTSLKPDADADASSGTRAAALHCRLTLRPDI